MLNRILDAITEPVTLADVKTVLLLETAEDDGLITKFITTARHEVENYAYMSLLTQTWEFTIDVAEITSPFTLPRPPLQSIESIIYVDTDGAEHTFDEINYWLDKSNECVRLKEDCVWETDDVVYYVVQYITGYEDAADIPQTWKDSIVLTAARLYERRDDTRMPKGLPNVAREMIPQRRRML